MTRKRERSDHVITMDRKTLKKNWPMRSLCETLDRSSDKDYLGDDMTSHSTDGDESTSDENADSIQESEYTDSEEEDSVNEENSSNEDDGTDYEDSFYDKSYSDDFDSDNSDSDAGSLYSENFSNVDSSSENSVR